jgi:Zn finger protein HypA/HybF involved in hydrogenase expression
MWQCLKCGERHEDSFDLCWNCGTSSDGIEDASFRKADEAETEPEPDQTALEGTAIGESAEKSPLSCSRCDCKLDYLGTKSFHEGTRWRFLGNIGELFVNRERFDVYCCPRCGRVEFFVDGIGEEHRPH